MVSVKKVIKEINSLYKKGVELGVEFGSDYLKEVEEYKDDFDSLIEIKEDLIRDIIAEVFSRVSSNNVLETYYSRLDDDGFGIIHRNKDFSIEYYPLTLGEKKVIVYVTLEYGVNNSKNTLRRKYKELLQKFDSAELELFKVERGYRSEPLINTQWDMCPREYAEIILNAKKFNLANDLGMFKEDLEKLISILIEWASQFEC